MKYYNNIIKRYFLVRDPVICIQRHPRRSDDHSGVANHAWPRLAKCAYKSWMVIVNIHWVRSLSIRLVQPLGADSEATSHGIDTLFTTVMCRYWSYQSRHRHSVYHRDVPIVKLPVTASTLCLPPWCADTEATSHGIDTLFTTVMCRYWSYQSRHRHSVYHRDVLAGSRESRDCHDDAPSYSDFGNIYCPEKYIFHSDSNVVKDAANATDQCRQWKQWYHLHFYVPCAARCHLTAWFVIKQK